MFYSENELVNNIELLKNLLHECDDLETKISGICTILYEGWFKDSTPQLDVVKKTIREKLNRYRAQLSEQRGN